VKPPSLESPESLNRVEQIGYCKANNTATFMSPPKLTEDGLITEANGIERSFKATMNGFKKTLGSKLPIDHTLGWHTNRFQISIA
jgi:hypothetical protein